MRLCQGALRQCHQLIGIAERLAIPQDGVIAGAFRVHAELPIRGPHERVKPIDGANGPRQTERDPIASPYVFEFMRECALHVGFAPRPRVWRKHNRGPHNATGHRTGYRLVHHDIDGSAESSPRAKSFVMICASRHGRL